MKCDVRLPYRMYVASLHFVFTLFGVSCRDISILNPEDASFLLQGCPKIHSTPPNFNMEPENKSLEKESPVGNHYFQVPC